MGGFEGAYQSYLKSQEWDQDDPDCPDEYKDGYMDEETEGIDFDNVAWG